MKTNKFDSLMEELSCEPRSSEYDDVFSSILRIDSKAREIAKGYGVPVGQIYKAIDFYPKGFVSEFGANQEGLDFAYSDVMRDLQVLEKQIVPESHRNYGGKLLPNFLNNEDALFGFLGPKPKPAGTGGEVVKRKEIVLKEEMGYVDKLIGWIGRHKALTATGIVGLFGLGLYATNDTVKNTADKYLKFAKDTAGKAAGYALFGGMTPVGIELVNATAKAAPQVSETSHQFTPDLKVFGSPEYVKKVQDSLDELNKTPDSFRINGMTAYEYATYYLDELHEGDKEKYIDVGIEQYPIKYISASNLIHIPRHIEQGQNQTFIADLRKWENGGKEDGGLFTEHGAIKLQVSWEKARYNLTDAQAIAEFNSYMKQYTNDSKYFEEELIKN